MSELLIPLAVNDTQRYVVLGILALLGLATLATGVFFIMGLFQQRKYNKVALPTLVEEEIDPDADEESAFDLEVLEDDPLTESAYATRIDDDFALAMLPESKGPSFTPEANALPSLDSEDFKPSTMTPSVSTTPNDSPPLETFSETAKETPETHSVLLEENEPLDLTPIMKDWRPEPPRASEMSHNEWRPKAEVSAELLSELEDDGEEFDFTPVLTSASNNDSLDNMEPVGDEESPVSPVTPMEEEYPVILPTVAEAGESKPQSSRAYRGRRRANS